MNCLCRPSRIITIRVVLLDESEFLHEIKDDLPGQVILDLVFLRLNLIESAYFGIRYLDEENQTHWLDASTRISRQLKHSNDIHNLYFGVKFYAADPCKLIEEITRYQLFLQLKQDVLQGRLPVSFELATELGALVVQSELGDYDPRRHSPGYVSEFRLVASQTKELENRISEIHQQLKGVSPTSAELKYLDKVKWHDMYGVDLHPVLGEDSVEYFLGLTPSGIIVLRNKNTVAHYYWPRIGKVFYKGKYFMLRVCDKNNEISTYGFETPKKSACKHLYRCCVEHHAFFRLAQTPMIPNGNGDIYSLQSRYHGRVPPTFTRLPSNRQLRRSMHESNSTYGDTSSMYNKRESQRISIPQNLHNEDNNNNNMTNGTTERVPGSPQSSKSMPRSRSQQRGLFGVAPSPRSVRSASRTDLSQPKTSSSQHFHRHRSSSVESHSSNESRSYRRYKSGNKHRRASDNESELSRGSGKSGHSHNSHRKNRRHRSKKRRNDSGSENESTRSRSYSGHRVSQANYELVDSELQWKEVQRKQSELKEVTSGVQQAAVIKSSNLTNSVKSQPQGDSSTFGHRSRKHRKHKSPMEGRGNIWTSELAKHLQFDLIDTSGMTEDQLREIPYTVIETNGTAGNKLSSNSLKVHKNGFNNHRLDRIRPTTNSIEANSYVSSRSGFADGSIRSASTINSSRDFNRGDNKLLRMMSNMSIDDFLSQSNPHMSPLEIDPSLRVSHEHTDSGLGADQDYAYSSERSNDSKTKYSTGGLGKMIRMSPPSSSSTNGSQGHHPHHMVYPKVSSKASVTTTTSSMNGTASGVSSSAEPQHEHHYHRYHHRPLQITHNNPQQGFAKGTVHSYTRSKLPSHHISTTHNNSSISRPNLPHYNHLITSVDQSLISGPGSGLRSTVATVGEGVEGLIANGSLQNGAQEQEKNIAFVNTLYGASVYSTGTVSGTIRKPPQSPASDMASLRRKRALLRQQNYKEIGVKSNSMDALQAKTSTIANGCDSEYSNNITSTSNNSHNNSNNCSDNSCVNIPSRSSSLKLILTPIIQSSKRAQ